MKLGFAVYAAGLVFLVVSIYFGWGNVAFFGYFIFGFALNRIVLRQIEWHHMHNTLSNVANAKLSSFLFLAAVLPVSFRAVVHQPRIIEIQSYA